MRNFETLEMTPEQVAYFQREYAEAKKAEHEADSLSKKELASAVCAELEKMAYFLGISQACLHAAIKQSNTIH